MQLGNHNSSVHVPTASQSSKSEPELLIERVRDVYSDLLPLNCTIFLQVKDEKWGGAFVNYFEGTVPDEYFQDSDRKEGCGGQLLVQKGSFPVEGIR